MTWKSVTGRTRLVKPSHELWTPHGYQKKASDFLVTNGAAALFADPGTGKTSTTLNAFCELLTSHVGNKMLVIAPKRVCQLVWWQESQKWSQFRHLKFAWLHNSRAPWDERGKLKKKDEEFEKDADVYLINPEGVEWLFKKLYNPRRRTMAKCPFDTIVIDELTKFKNARARRSKNLRKITASGVRRIWGLTGSPTPNGYEDLFGQILQLDGGTALGSYYTAFRDKYFDADGFGGFKYKLREGADKRIEDRIAHMVLRISARDFLDLPESIDDPIMIRLDTKTRAKYDELKKEALLRVDNGVITAANSAALYSKLAQLANGSVYLEQDVGDKRTVHHVHNAKIEALEDLVEQLGGQPLLVGYEFNHDLDKLKEWYQKRTGKPLRYLGKGVKDSEVFQIEKDWNEGLIDILPCHPASAGHGLNFQKGNACHLCWFSATWDFELYDQFLQRILRQGNKAPHVFNHLLLVEDSIDVLKYEALQDKDTTQERFLQAINTAFIGDPVAGKAATKTKEKTMVRKLGGKTAPKGWGKPAKQAEPEEVDTDDEDTEEVDEEEQREAISTKLRGKRKATKKAVEPEDDDEDEVPDGRGAFSKKIQDQLDDDEDDEDGEDEPEPTPKRKTTRKRATKKAAPKAEENAPTAGNTVSARPPFEQHVSMSINFDAEGNPVPSVSLNVNGDFDEAAAVRGTELIIAMLNRFMEESD